MLAIKGRGLFEKISSFFGRFPIGTKIIFGYIVLVFMMAAGTAGAVWTLNFSGANYALAVQRQKDIATLNTIQIFFEKQNANLSDLVLNHNKATLGVFRANSEKIKALVQELSPDMVREAEKNILLDISKKNDLIEKTFTSKVTPLFDKNDSAALIAEIEGVRSITNNVETDIQKLSTEIETDSRTTINSASANTSFLSYLLSGLALLGAVIGIVLGILLSRNISGRVKVVGKSAAALSEGDLSQIVVIRNGDEIGKMAQAFSVMIDYLREIASLAEGVSVGNLKLTASPKSSQDTLGNAFKVMLQNLRTLINNVRGNADRVGSAAEALSSAASETQHAASQIATTIQQVAVGTGKQSEAAMTTAQSMDQMNNIIHTISEGARKQSEAVNQAAAVTQKISQAIHQVNGSMQIVQQESANTEAVAQTGAATINNTIRQMQTIREKVGLSTEKVLEMGKNSDQIEGILGTIQDIASQTNLLALNAAIEAARSSGITVQTSQNLIHSHLLAAANMVNMLISSYALDLQDKDLAVFCEMTGVDVLLISDEDGVISVCSDTNIKGYRFSEDPKEQSYEFRVLLNSRDGKILQPVQARSVDNKPYVWVGVSRREKPGIIQAGMFGEIVYRSADYVRGFNVVAEEVRKLAENATSSTKEIGGIIKAISRTVHEAVAAMDEGAKEVEAGVKGTGEAGSALGEILKSVETVHQQVKEAARASGGMNEASNQLMQVMDTVSAVVDENTAATDEMLAKSEDVSQAIDNITSVSEENGAAVEEVSASIEEISAQIHSISDSAAELDNLGKALQKSMGSFQL